MQSIGVGDRVDRVLELVVVWVLTVSGIGLLATLAGHFLAPQVCIAGTLLTGLYAWLIRGRSQVRGAAPDWKHVVLLVLVCLFFRLPVFNYVLGGQDEGLYVNTAHYIEKTGGVAVYDTALEKLQGTPFVERYLSENRESGVFVSGIYLHSPQGSQLEFQFYHLFSVWMAIFAGIFGSTFAVYALTLFALLSVLFMYRLTLALTDSPPAALIAGLLLALNPLHAFFSKFPVTEVPTLAFSLMGFTYLALFWRAAPESRRRLWLVLSSLSFGALFATRISGFMYVPFFVFMAIAGVIADEDRARQQFVHFWAVSVVALYAWSVVYGLHWSHHYSVDIYRLSFERIFSTHWRARLAVVVAVVLMAWGGITLAARTRIGGALGGPMVTLVRRAIGPLVIVSLMIGLYRIHQLGWTTHFQGDVGLDTTWGLAGTRWHALKASSLAALFVYLGPLLPLAFLGLVLRRQDDPPVEFLRLFVAGFFAYIVLLQWVVPYGPYYARYLLSEAVPYMLLFVVLVWVRMRAGYVRNMLSIVMAATMIYGGTVSSAQLGKNENGGLYQSLGKLLSPVDAGDVVLLDVMGLGLPNNSEIKTPIMFTFGLPAITVSDSSLKDAAYIAALNARYNDVFVLSPSASTPPGFDSIGSSRIKVWAYQWSHSYPRKIVLREDMNLYLFRLTKPIFPSGHPLPPSAWGQWLASGWDSPGITGVWSLGNHAEIDIDPPVLPHFDHGVRLTFSLTGLLTAAHAHQRILVSLNGAHVANKNITYPQSVAHLDVDVPAAVLNSTRKIRIAFDLPDAATPKSLGINIDQRMLAIMLKTLTASPLHANSVGSPKPVEPAMTSTAPSPRRH